jgi:hypothetical protein
MQMRISRSMPRSHLTAIASRQPRIGRNEGIFGLNCVDFAGQVFKRECVRDRNPLPRRAGHIEIVSLGQPRAGTVLAPLMTDQPH